MRRFVLPLTALAFFLLGASAFPAYADETPPPVRSSPGDPFGGETIPPGPVFVITPGSPGSTLGPSADPEDVQEQIEKDKQAQATAGPSGSPTAGSSASTGTVEPTDGAVGPETVAGANQDAAEDDDASTALWWSVAVGGAAVVALMTVLLIGLRRRDRGGSDSLKDHAP